MTEMVEGSTTISVWQAIGIYRRMTWTRLRRGRLRWALYTMIVIPLLIGIGIDVVALAGGTASQSVDLFDNLFTYYEYSTFIMAALATSSIISEEIESKTFTFLFARPAPKWALPIGKYLATISVCCVAFAGSMIVAYCLCMLPSGGSDFVEHLPRLGRSIFALLLGLLASGALATLIGSWFTRYPFVMVMMVLMVTEGLFIVAKLPVGSLRWHMENIVRQQPASLIFSEVNVASWISIVSLTGLTVLWLGLTAVAAAGAEYRTDR